MTRKPRNRLLELAGISHRARLLLEEEEEDMFADDADDAGDDEEDEGAEEGEDSGGESDEEAGEETDDEEDEEEEEEDEEEVPDEKVSPSDLAKYGPGEIDTEINSIIQNIYDTSVSSASVNSSTSISYPGSNDKVVESIKKYSMKGFLLNETGDITTASEFNLDHFTSEIARYINNYQSLLDMEGMLFNKARQFLLNQFGTDLEASFVEKLALTHNLDFESMYEDEIAAPIATGGSAEAAGV